MKSTLLKILSRITSPTTGELRARGRIASILEVGTGFHPELTGKENIYLNGAILGMSRAEIRAPVSGFLQTIYREEGQDVEPGTIIVVLDVPDLSSKISEKEAEVNEARAKLRLAEVGPRKEEVQEQRQKVVRAKSLQDLMQVQAEFVKSQAEALQAQLQD